MSETSDTVAQAAGSLSPFRVGQYQGALQAVRLFRVCLWGFLTAGAICFYYGITDASWITAGLSALFFTVAALSLYSQRRARHILATFEARVARLLRSSPAFSHAQVDGLVAEMRVHLIHRRYIVSGTIVDGPDFIDWEITVNPDGSVAIRNGRS